MRTKNILVALVVFGWSALMSNIACAQFGRVVAGPDASAAEIRAAHGESIAPVRRLTFEVSGGFENPSGLRVDLGTDYIYTVRSDRDELLDFKLRRHIIISSDRQTFANTSIYADIAFRVNEAQNCQYLSKVLGSVGMKPDAVPTVSPIDAATQLGLVLPGTAEQHIDQITDANGTVHFSYQGKELAHVHFGSNRIIKSEQVGFARFLRWEVTLHPQIADAIIADGRFPDELSYLEYKGSESKFQTLTLKTNETAMTDYPLPATYSSDFFQGATSERTELNNLLPIMLSAVAGRAGGGPRSAASYREAIEAASQRGDKLQAMVLILELSLHHGNNALSCAPDTRPPCHSLKEIARIAENDPQGQSLLQTLTYNGANAANGVPLLRKIDRRGLSDPYMIDIFLANDLGHNKDAEELYASAIRGNPYIVGFYKDFGDYCFNEYDMWDAWLLYDLARDLPDARDTPMLDAVDTLEHRLANDFPQFFK